MEWDEVDNFPPTTYVVTWISERDCVMHSLALSGLTSYAITGLTLDTIYTITVTAHNRCGGGPEYRTSVSLTSNPNSTVSSHISAAGTTNINSMITTCTTNPHYHYCCD